MLDLALGVLEGPFKAKPPCRMFQNEIRDKKGWPAHASVSSLPQWLRKREDARQADIHSGAASFRCPVYSIYM